MSSGVASIVANLIYIGFNIHSWKKWKEEPEGVP